MDATDLRSCMRVIYISSLLQVVGWLPCHRAILSMIATFLPRLHPVPSKEEQETHPLLQPNFLMVHASHHHVGPRHRGYFKQESTALSSML